MGNSIKYSYESLKKFCTDAFLKFGFTQEESDIIVDVLLTSDLYGIESHGMQRLVRYHKGIEKGLIKPQAKPEVVFETPVSAVIEAGGANAQAIADAKKAGTDAQAYAEGVAADLAEYETDNNAAVALKADQTALDAEVTARTTADTGLSGRIKALEDSNAEGGANAAAIADAKAAGTAAQAYAEGVNTALESYKTSNNTAVAAAQTAADNAQDAADAAQATADAAQVKSTTMSLGAAGGVWTDLTSATVGYATDGLYTLSLDKGSIKWVKVNEGSAN